MLKNSTSGLIGMAQEILSCADRVDELAKVSHDAGLPILVIYGENDNAWSPRAQAAMADRLAADKIVIPGAAHSPAVEAPETAASALTSFWNRAERGAR
jgi:pimeloyl-ACP methyl ester carboxylesterase